MIENEEAEKAQDKNICHKHKQPLTVYCDNEKCQELLCATCIVVKHRDHEIVDLDDKVDRIKNMSDWRYGAERQINTERQELLWKDANMDDLLKEIQENASEACKEIDKQKAIILNKYMEAMDEVEKQANSEKVKIGQIKQRQLKSATSLQRNMRKRIESLDKASELLNQIRKINDRYDIIRNGRVVSAIHKEIGDINPEIEEWANSYGEIKFKTDVDTKFIKPKLGEIICEKNATTFQNFGLAPRREKFTSTTLSFVKRWETDTAHDKMLTSNSLGQIFTGMDGLVAFDLDGREVLNVPSLTAHGRTMSFYHGNGEDLLLIGDGGNKFEVRDTLGKLLYAVPVPKASCVSFIRQDTPESVLVTVGHVLLRSYDEFMPMHWELQQFVETEGKFVRGSKTINIPEPLLDIQGFTIAECDNKKIIVVSSAEDYYILALDYQSATVLWAIDKAKFEGKNIYPYDICTDGHGHLFLLDMANYHISEIEKNPQRLLLLDMNGWIERQIHLPEIDEKRAVRRHTCGLIYRHVRYEAIMCIQNMDKLVIMASDSSVESSNKYVFWVYDINY